MRALPAVPAGAGLEFFERKVRPLFAENCYSCHGEEKQKGDLRLDSPGAIRAGGERGTVVSPGEPEKSRLILAVGYQDEDLKMPPKKRLTARQIADLAEWVRMGAPMPDSDVPPATAPALKEFKITDKDRAHWAFQPVRRPLLPAVKDRNWATSPIDAFILAKLEAKGLAPNPRAGQRELIRRAYYDLTGLPPSPRDVENFLADTSLDAYERVIDRLLDSPRYGEKWGRHWLDLVRFAESNSYERDGAKPHAWRYRDYVIRSFNADKPYDRFIREQLAGDELPNADAEAIIATGFYRLGIWDDEPADRELARYDGLDDMVTTTGQIFLGLTVDCARCHNHKIDPISQRDYYRFVSFFENINHYRNGGPTDEVPLAANAAEKLAYEQAVRELEKKRADLQTAIDETEKLFLARYEKSEHSNQTEKRPKREIGKLIKEAVQVLGQERVDQYEKWKQELNGLRKEKIPGKMALAVTERGPDAPETFLLVRGNPGVKGDKVEPAFVEVLNPRVPELPTPPPTAKTSGRRTVLANWIASADNQLTARVMVNRIWQYHFGRGLVRSPNNFGVQGDRPTHPDLLDWLASELVAQGWRLKPLHRLIMMSNAYRMSSRGRAEALEADPANDLFWRFDMRRLGAEEIRDTILALSGTLNLKMFGPGVYVNIPKEVMAGQSQPGLGWGKSPADEQARRSVYIHLKRSLLTPILESFDMAETDRSAPVRFATTQPTQALGMLNGEFLNQQAALCVERLRKEGGEDLKKQVQLALSLATARPPSPAEIERGVALIESLKATDGASQEVAMKYFCLMVLNLNEMIYLD